MTIEQWRAYLPALYALKAQGVSDREAIRQVIPQAMRDAQPLAEQVTIAQLDAVLQKLANGDDQ